MLSNVRGEPGYIKDAAQAQTPRSEIKMPPVGNFAPPPSAGKDNKKRRGGAGSQVTGGASAQGTPSTVDVGSGASLAHGARGIITQPGNVSKVSRGPSSSSSKSARLSKPAS